MDAGGYKHNYEGFYEKFTYQMSINRGITTTRVGWSRSRSGFWHIIRSTSEFGLGLGLGPPRSRFGSVLTSVSLDHGYTYLKRDKYINVY